MIQNEQIHKSCVCYQKESHETISLVELPQGEAGQSYLKSHIIIFILKGSAKYLVPTLSENAIVNAGEFIFFPTSTNMIWETLSETTVLYFRLSHIVSRLPECATFRFQRLSNNLSQSAIGDTGPSTLKMNERIRHFIEGVIVTERDGLKCNNYARHLAAQLLTLIQVYYTEEEYMRFYSFVATSDVLFSDLVYEKWVECRTVGELAGIFDMSTQQFSQRFAAVFGECPGSWLQKRRKEYIFHDICSSHKSLKQIAAEHDFSMANFIRYCRMNYDNTPGGIRENLTVDMSRCS
jgi:AraC-like DNA-binding protein